MKMELPLLPPVDIKENWPGQFDDFTWFNFIVSVPTAVFIVTTLKENGLANAQLNAWGLLLGGSREPKFILQVVKTSDTYRLIEKNREFAISYPTIEMKDRFMKTITHYDHETDEIIASDLTPEACQVIKAPRIKECVSHLECQLDWIKDVGEVNPVNALIQGSVVSAAIDQSVLSDDLRESYAKRGVALVVPELLNPVTKVNQSNAGLAVIDRVNMVDI